MREQVLRFGSFELFRAQKILLERGTVVRLGSRALDILIALVERAGEVVSKNELISYAWPTTFVEESNLRVHVAAIRKMLGDGQNGARFIINVVGRGYSFVATVTRAEAVAPTHEPQSAPVFRLPPPSTRMLGRSEALHAIEIQLRKKRLVSIVGPAGVGKTTLALALCEHLLEAYGRRVCFVDLATVEDPAAVPLALATLLGISALTEDPIASVIASLCGARILIVLDNCEHVITAAAQLVAALVRQAPDVSILATSREPLWVPGELTCNLEPLAMPPEGDRLNAVEAIRFSAIELFVERATAGLESFQLTDENVEFVASICRRVDGIPLAIELIAARTNLFGVETLAQGFGDDLLLRAKGAHAVKGRQQSLRATLDWSYRTLLPQEQILLRRLSVFRGAFTAESAGAVAVDASINIDQALEALLSLAGKSLLMTDVSDRTIRYRLLHVTRVYAAEKLADSHEQSAVFRAHAEHARAVLEAALARWEHVTREEWLARYERMIDDVRAALDWAFGPNGNLELGTALTVASLPFGFQLSLIDEFKTRAQRALESLTQISPRQLLCEIRITNSLVSLLHATGAPDEALTGTITRAVKLAEECGDPRRLIEPYTTRTILSLEAGNYVAALKAADALQAAASQTDDGLAHLMADRVGAQVHFNAGDFARARLLAERVLRHPARALPLIYGQVPIDRRVSMRNVMARTLWIQGKPDEAEAVIAEAIAIADGEVPSTFCQSLGLAGIPIAFWRGDTESALRRTEDLLDRARRYNFNRWYRLGLCYQRILSDRLTLPGHDVESGSVAASPVSTLQREILSTIVPSWMDAHTTRRAQDRLCGWSNAELLRACGEIEVKRGEGKCMERAETQLLGSLEIARQQEALSWELRAVTSLSQLWWQQGRTGEAYQVLSAVYQRFVEGHATADLRRARTLLTQIEAALLVPSA